MDILNITERAKDGMNDHLCFGKNRVNRWRNLSSTI